MLRPTRPSGVRRVAGPAAGLAIVAGITAFDIAAGPGTIVIGTVVLGAFVTAMVGSPAQTVVVAAVAAACAVLSGVWNENFGDVPYLLRCAVVLAGGAIAVLAAVGRRQHALQRAAFALLTALSRTVDEPMTARQTTSRLEGLLVPAIADICVIDVVRDGGVARLSVKASGRDAAEIEQLVRARPLNQAETGVGTFAAIASDRAQLFHNDDPVLERSATNPADLALLRRLDIRSTAVLPLRTRGQVLGALSVGMRRDSGRRYREGDLEFLQVVAGRVALALDNAGLSRDVRDLEDQLRIALGDLSDAVTVTDAEGRAVYANRVALELLGFETEDELYATDPEDVMARFDITDEDGEPITLDALPGSRLLRGEHPVAPLLVRNVVRATGEERWLINKTSPVFGEDGDIVRVVNVIENVTDLKQEERAGKFIASASEILASSLDYQHTLQQVADMVVPALADWCGVALPDGRGAIRTVAVAHENPEKVTLAQRLADRYPEDVSGEQGAALVLRTGNSLLVNDVTDELLAQAARDAEHFELIRGLGLHAGMTVPLCDSRGTVLGTLSLVSAESKRTFGVHDLKLAEEIGRRAGIAVENARLYTERSEIATTLQQALLPDELPRIPGWRVASSYRPVGKFNEVGGDFYDAFETPGGWMIVIGDVTGHGAAAARLTGTARATLRAVGTLTGDLRTSAERLNAALCDEPRLTLVTAACVMVRPSLDDDGAVVDVICCGHPPPLKVTKSGVRAVEASGLILGVEKNATWRQVSENLRTGDYLTLYTDGVTDVLGASGRFGPERLAACLAPTSKSAQDVIDDLTRRIDAFRVHPQTDDEALLVLQHRPSTQPRREFPQRTV